MTKRRSSNPESSTLSAKKARGEGRTINHKFDEEHLAKVVVLEPKTQNQKTYLDLLKSKDVVFAVGSSGSGKTFMACTHAANKLLKKEIDRIVLIRPYEFVGRSVGLRPGTSSEKLLPLMQSMLEPIKAALGAGQYEYALEHGQVVLEALEDCRGRSYKNSLIICDEATNMGVKEIQTLITRIDRGSQIVFCGDTACWQKDISGQSGLAWMLDLITKIRKEKPEYLDIEDYDELYNNIGIVTFNRQDCVRSGMARLFVKVFDEVK